MSDKQFKLITREMATEILSCSLTTLDALVASGALIPPKSLVGSRRKYWLPEVFEGYLRQLLGNGGVDDANPQIGPPIDPPRPTLESNAPERAGMRPKIIKPSTLKSRRSKRIERLNK